MCRKSGLLIMRVHGMRRGRSPAGLGVTGLIQSSTATGLMAMSFTAAGVIELAPALKRAADQIAHTFVATSGPD